MANQGLLTVGDIIKQGLQQGGNPGLSTVPAGETISYGLRGFRLILHNIYLNNDLPVLETEASVATTNDYEVSLASLTRYRSINAVYISTDTIGKLDQEDYKTIWYRLQESLVPSPSTKGTPTTFAVTPDRSKLLLYPIPNKTLTAKILYYRIPDVSGYVDATTAATLDWEDSMSLVAMMEEFARNWDGVINLAALSAAIAERAFGRYKVAAEDRGRAGAMRLKLSTQYFNYKRGD